MPEDRALDIGAVVFMVLLAAEIGRSLLSRWVLSRRVVEPTKTGDREG